MARHSCIKEPAAYYTSMAQHSVYRSSESFWQSQTPGTITGHERSSCSVHLLLHSYSQAVHSRNIFTRKHLLFYCCIFPHNLDIDFFHEKAEIIYILLYCCILNHSQSEHFLCGSALFDNFDFYLSVCTFNK